MENKRYRLWRCIAANIMYKFASQETKSMIDADVERYLSKSSIDTGHKSILFKLDLLLSSDRTFRCVFYYRFKGRSRLCSLSKLFLPDIKAIEIYGDIAQGLFLSHNHMVVHTRTAGKNLRVGPGVVIGKNNGKYPIIGDNVYIAANSTVIGDITIGDNVIIEPGSVVTKSLDGNAVYAGNPTRFVKHIDDDPRLMGLIT